MIFKKLFLFKGHHEVQDNFNVVIVSPYDMKTDDRGIESSSPMGPTAMEMLRGEILMISMRMEMGVKSLGLSK